MNTDSIRPTCRKCSVTESTSVCFMCEICDETYEISQLSIKYHSPTHRLLTNHCSRGRPSMKHDVIHSNSCSSVLWSSVTSRPAASTCSTTEPRSKLQTWNRVLKEEMSSKLKRRSVIGLDQQNHHLLCSSVELLACFSFWFWFCRTSYT